MKLMMKKWLVRPVALLLLVFLVFTDPAYVMAADSAAPVTGEEAAVELNEKTAVETEETGIVETEEETAAETDETEAVETEEASVAETEETAVETEAAVTEEAASEEESSEEETSEKGVEVLATKAPDKDPSGESPTAPTTAPVKYLKDIMGQYKLTVSDQEICWDGQAKTPEVKLVYTGKGEAVASTMKVTYKNNTKVGTAKVSAVISAKGYKGTVTKTAEFDILPKKPAKPSLKKPGLRKLTATCPAFPEEMTAKTGFAWSYRFELLHFNKTKKAWTVCRTVNTDKPENEFKKLSSARNYKVRVTYVAEGDKIYKSPVSKLAQRATAPKKAKLASAKKTGANSMMVTWKALEGVSGYEIQYSKKDTFSKATKVKVTKAAAVSKKIKDLKSDGVFYVRIRGYRTCDGKKSYGEWSKAKLTCPPRASRPKLADRSSDSLKFKVAPATASGLKYQFKLYKFSDKKNKWVKADVAKTDDPSCEFKSLTAGRAYQVKVRLYKELENKEVYGEWSIVRETATTPATVVIDNAVKTTNGKLKISWTPVSYGNGYEVQYSTSSSFKKSKTETARAKGITRTSKKVKISSSSDYYARVRAYVIVKGKKVYGSWSDKRYTSYSNVYASYTTYYDSGNYNRSTNLRLACQAMNGTIIMPGQTFSYNSVVGERTAAKGYREAIIYEGGREVGGIGGGICQTATTLFNAVLKANFKINERHQHSMTVHYAPLGYDAAIAWGSKNLRFTNTSGVPVKLYAVASGGVLTMKFLTNVDVKPPKVTTSVSLSNRVYTLRRYVNGSCNYVTTSKYLDV